MKYCNCKNPEPEQVKHNYIVCMACNLPIEQSEDAPEPDIDEHEEFEERVAIDEQRENERQEDRELSNIVNAE